MGASSKEKANGAIGGWDSGSFPHRCGTPSEATVSSWARPIVATVRISRGARVKRSITTPCTSPPTTTAPRSPTANAAR
jgi:hypothetical protein